MQPTPRADALIGPTRDALGLLRRISGNEPAFDPGAAQRNFRLCMTDADHITLLPRLLAHVRELAPGIRLDVAPISAATPHMLETGEADLALGYIPGLEAGFHEQRLYTQDFVCLVNARHPRIGAAFTARAYREEAHIGILSSTSYTMLQSSLRRQGIDRRVQLELPGFLGLAAIVSSTDLVATVPRTIGESLAATGTIRVCACPVKIPTFTVKRSVYWFTGSNAYVVVAMPPALVWSPTWTWHAVGRPAHTENRSAASRRSQVPRTAGARPRRKARSACPP